jgi:very-short-patch-repair endonuclease
LKGSVCALEHVRGAGEVEIVRLARVQHACAHRDQLLLAGVGPGAIKHRLKAQRYLLLHRAVYLIDSARRDEWTATMAMVLLFAGDALVSHRGAGSVWGLLDGPPPAPEVTLVGRGAHSQSGVTIHRVTSVDPCDVRWRRDLPVTSPARTVVDLAGTLTALELEDVLAMCLEKRLASLKEIEQAIDRAPATSPGIGTLRRLLRQGGFARTRSYYERKLLKLIADAGLPRPLTNHRMAGHEVDLVWLEQKLVVEFDGRKFHGDRRAFETDRRRDQDLVAAGYRVIRVTARQLEQEPYVVVARLAAALAV